MESALFLIILFRGRRNIQVSKKSIHFSRVFGRIVEEKVQFRDDPELVTNPVSELLADRAAPFLDHIQKHFLIGSSQKAQVHPRNAQVGRHTYVRHGDERPVEQVPAIALKDFAQIFLQ